MSGRRAVDVGISVDTIKDNDGDDYESSKRTQSRCDTEAHSQAAPLSISAAAMRASLGYAELALESEPRAEISSSSRAGGESELRRSLRAELEGGDMESETLKRALGALDTLCDEDLLLSEIESDSDMDKYVEDAGAAPTRQSWQSTSSWGVGGSRPATGEQLQPATTAASPDKSSGHSIAF